MSFALSLEAKKLIVPRLQRYADEELDRELGNLEAEFLIDFLAELLGPEIYNQGLKDARTVLQERLNDLDDALQERERALPR